MQNGSIDRSATHVLQCRQYEAFSEGIGTWFASSRCVYHGGFNHRAAEGAVQTRVQLLEAVGTVFK